MHDELEVASLASEYVRRRDSLQKTERRMVRYMKAQDERRQDDSPLYGQLSAAGLTPDGWHELVTKSTPPDSGKGSGSDRGSAGPPPELGVLAVLLSELDNLMKSGGTGGAGQAVQVAGKIDQEVGKLADGTRRKIEALGQVSQAEPPSTGPAGKKGRDQSRRDELLTEIVQELCQPASVINCCVDMLAGGYMGPLADEQKTILTTAASSGIRLESLLSRLREVIGVPAGLTPNREILG
jgi:hypothetical protein